MQVLPTDWAFKALLRYRQESILMSFFVKFLEIHLHEAVPSRSDWPRFSSPIPSSFVNIQKNFNISVYHLIDTISSWNDFYPTLPLVTMVLCLALPEFLDPSNPYIPPAKKTMKAPIRVPAANLFPNSQMLNNRLTNFRTLSTIVTVSADDAEARRFTPRMHAYCVRTFMTRYTSWLGRCMAPKPFWTSAGRWVIES
jgi:hypothetical protein